REKASILAMLLQFLDRFLEKRLVFLAVAKARFAELTQFAIDLRRMLPAFEPEQRPAAVSQKLGDVFIKLPKERVRPLRLGVVRPMERNRGGDEAPTIAADRRDAGRNEAITPRGGKQPLHDLDDLLAAWPTSGKLQSAQLPPDRTGSAAAKDQRLVAHREIAPAR